MWVLISLKITKIAKMEKKMVIHSLRIFFFRNANLHVKVLHLFNLKVLNIMKLLISWTGDLS